ncbi:uncharacterized protein LOC128254602 [Drosophila gunungcola]|uniref:uncharacterized protein LOC128254602 n=1 Tax=Drosophila gunungcola TaxID=103775 RepID=UPI0022E509CF|nr:uncharacterized protein LOC128254602 [Drosophila gunungcola]
MKWISLFLPLLALLSLANVGYARTIPKITIRNGDIIVHGNCHGCTARATKNSAYLSFKFTRRC